MGMPTKISKQIITILKSKKKKKKKKKKERIQEFSAFYHRLTAEGSGT